MINLDRPDLDFIKLSKIRIEANDLECYFEGFETVIILTPDLILVSGLNQYVNAKRHGQEFAYCLVLTEKEINKIHTIQ